MRIIQVDSVRLKPSQTLLAFTFDLRRAQSTGRSRIIERQFRPDHHLVPRSPLVHPFADRCFALTALKTFDPTRVKIGGIDKSPTIRVKEIKQPETGDLIALAAK